MSAPFRPPPSHLTREEIARFSARVLLPDAIVRLGVHLERCLECRGRVAAVLGRDAVDAWAALLARYGAPGTSDPER